EMGVLINSMKEISQDSKKISEIISVIDDIAFQTNLLALNAAVEAARAGEQGKGFAVVAEAVRTLAQRSALAAKDISNLIKSSVGRMESGGAQVEKSGAVLTEILNSINKVTHLNQEISTASSEQAHGISQISQAMNQMDQVTQVNAASSEEAAASAEELSAQAQSMTLVIHELVRVIRGEVKVEGVQAEYKKRPSTVKVSVAA
ncbi:MAG TPA: methyl-accepting chemotaxis protein, partial [Bdellovibrio sp.]